MHVFVNPNDLCFVNNRVSAYLDDGRHVGYANAVDHPSFANTRLLLISEGFIESGLAVNADIVLKDFYFNNAPYIVGERFPCAAADIKKRSELYNEGNIIQ